MFEDPRNNSIYRMIWHPNADIYYRFFTMHSSGKCLAVRHNKSDHFCQSFDITISRASLPRYQMVLSQFEQHDDPSCKGAWTTAIGQGERVLAREYISADHKDDQITQLFRELKRILVECMPEELQP